MTSKKKEKTEISKDKGTQAVTVKKASKSNVPKDFQIVGIGASAGGLEALEQFFSNMPKDSGMAFVVIQHLDPTHAGIMPELLQRITEMKVFQATDRLKTKPDCVYVIPPNKSLSILNGTLYLFDPVQTRGLRLPVDYFLRSLAEDQQQRSIGIILSGMGSDGSLGLKAIKEKNGTVLVQSPESAKYDGMPRSATEAVIPDIIAPADELPAKLLALLKYIPSVKTDIEIDSKTRSNIEKIILLIRERTGHDFSLYKKNTIFRRIERRKGIHQIDKINNYVRFLSENPHEVDILFKELLIGVTSFFRDTAVWEKLGNTVLPDLINELPEGHVIRVWVTGCSTGEEAYSLAIIFKEALEKTKKKKKISMQIFATDLDVDAIEKARKGIFPANIAADVSQERLARFFTNENEYYRINTPLREMVVFANQNIIKDPPFTKLDFLTCRNLLIYMEPVLQKKIFSLFRYSLNAGGILLIGTSETLISENNVFTEIDAKLKIFQRSSKAVLSEINDFPASSYPVKSSLEKNIQTKTVESIQTLIDRIIIQRFAPASVLVNDKGDILYISGRTGKYLEPSAGKANWNIYAMARDGLRDMLPGAFRKAMQNYDEVQVRNIKIGTNGDTQFVNVTVQRIQNPEAIRGLIIMVFTDVPIVVKQLKIDPKTGKAGSTGRLKELEVELQRSYEDIQSTHEEMQTSQEEMKSINEELQSTNEELQSTNEELTTSKEEMQSLNEELQTVNIELQSKITDYMQANNDMKNLLNSTEIATLFLDRELNIRRYTDQIVKIFKLRDSDVGRPFTDLVTDLNYPEMAGNVIEVLRTLVSVESVISTNDGRWFNVRIMPYRTSDDHIDGVVITFNDITTTKLSEVAMVVSETRYRRLFETANDGILILDAATGMIDDVNPYLIKMLGYSKEQFIQKAIWEIGFFKDIVSNKDKFYELQQKDFLRYENMPLETADGRTISVEFISNVYSVDKIKVIQFNIRDITDRIRLHEAPGMREQ